MRGLQLLALVFGLVQGGSDEQVGPTSAGGKQLEEVYGTVKPVGTMVPWHIRQTTRIGRPEQYFKQRSTEDCSFPLEIVILQDATRSFEDDFAEMKSVQLPLMVDMLSERHPGTTFSVVTFRDKPVWSLGEPRTDYCQRFELPMTADKAQLTAVYDKLEALGGGDPSENQFGALVALAQSPTVGWQNPAAAKLVVVVTDAPPHFEGDGLNGYGMSQFSGVFNEAEATRQCLSEYYPTPQQVMQALTAREAYAAFLIFDGDWWSSLPSESWKWFNTFLGQPEEFVRPLSSSSVDFWEQLDKVITDLAAIECGTATTTTTPAPTEPVLTVTLDGNTLISTTDVPPATTTTTTPITVPATTPATTTTTTTTTTPPPGTVIVCPSVPPCEEEPCPPCEGECCHDVDIRLRHKPAKLHLDIYN